MIREKDATLCSRDEQLKVEKEQCEAKLSKLRLQNKAKVTSLTTQLEELKKQQGGQDSPTHSKKGPSEGGDQANRGKIVLLKKKVEELEQQLTQREEELQNRRKEVEAQQQRGEEMDVMLTEKDRKLAEKEAYIIHLQTALAGDQPVALPPQQKATEEGGAMQELQLLVQSLTRKVGEADERYSLLQEQTDSLKELLASEKEQYSQKESMYKQNIQTFKDIILQKDNQLMEMNQMHEQELFKLAAKSDASADLEQLLKALKQKLHEKEEVLLGKTQVIDVLQGEVDGRDQQIKELMERLRRQQVERENLESKMEAEKHVMRAQLRDLMEKQQAEVRQMTEQHQALLAQTQQDLLGQLEELRRSSAAAAAAPSASQEASGAENLTGDSAFVERIAELEAQTKHKTDEASRSEAKFLKMKAWSKSRIRQLEEELKKSQAGFAPPDLTALRSRVTALEEEREENLWKVEQYDDVKAKNEMLEAKLVVYEEQQRTLQTELEQFTKRAASQASESGSADDTQSQVLEWQEMVAEAVSARDRAREEKTAMVLRISHMEEEREALVTRQQELEEELAQARGLNQHRAKKLGTPAQRNLQEDFEFDGQVPYQDPRSTSESSTPMEGENMGGWWPEYSTPDTGGLRSVVEELELERNQLQEQILSLEERCQDLEDRLQLQARIEALQVTFDVDEDEQPYWVSQNETEKLQSQLATVRSQQSRDAEKHHLLVSSLNEQLKGLSDTQECLESSLIEKENTLAKTSEKLELINSLRESLSGKEIQYKEVSEKLLQTEHTLDVASKKCSSSEKQCSELKGEVVDLTQKLSVLRDKTQKQEVTIETLQIEVDQTNEELDKLNTAHLEERAQLIHDLQSCEREIDSLKDSLLEKDKEISVLSGNMAEYTEQVTALKQELKLKGENLVQVENALSKAEQEAMIMRNSQNSDQQSLNSKITELIGKIKDTEMELIKAKEEKESKVAEVEHLIKQAEEDRKTIQALRGETQRHIMSHRNHLSECETHITSLREQLILSTQRLQESEGLVLELKDKNTNNEKQLIDKEQTFEKELKSFKDEQNKLLAQVEKYHGDVESLSKQLEEQAQSEQNIKKCMQDKLEIIASLEDKLETTAQQAEGERQKFNAELQVKDLENQKLSKEIKNNSEKISKFKNLLKSMKTEKEQLQEKVKGLTEELELQKENVKQLNEKVATALELKSSLEKQVHSMTKEKERLELEVDERVKTISEVTLEKDSLQAKISLLETQHSQNNKIIQDLEKEKEDLTAQANELNRLLEQSTLSNSEILLAKTNECSNLNCLLREKEDKVIQLQEEVQSFTSKVGQLQQDIEGREQIASELRVQIESQRNEQTQLQDTLALLQEQACTLKSCLLEKDLMLKEKAEECHSFQDEMIQQKTTGSNLRAEVESLHEERSQLHKKLTEREEMLKSVTQQCQTHKNQLIDGNKTVVSLNDQIREVKGKSQMLESEAEQRKTELVSLKSQIQTLTEENQQLHAACKSREQELDQQIHITSDLDGKLKATLEQNSNLSLRITTLIEDSQRLEEELAQSTKSFSELITEKSVLQEKHSCLEIQISDNQRVIEELVKDKEKLTVAESELKHILKESEMSNSVGLLEKTNECANLSEALREREAQIQNLQEQCDSLKIQLSQLNIFLNEKEHLASEKSSQLEAQQTQLLQLQDTISMLQEQGSVLKSGLMEKDALVQQKAEECGVFQKEVTLQKHLISQMEDELDSLRQVAKQQIEQKEEMLKEVTNDSQNLKDELNKRNESVISLSSQLGAMNENLAEMELEVTNLKATVQSLTADNCQLKQEEDQRKADIIGLTDSIKAVNDQNVKLKSELQKTVTELSEAQETVTHLKTAISDRDIQLKTVWSEREQLISTTQGKDDSLKQQENTVQQLNSRIVEQDVLLMQRVEDNAGLKAQIAELEDSAAKLRDQVQGLTSESSMLKNVLENAEQSSLEYQSNSSVVVANLNANLQTKEQECESLKERISHLEESVTKINKTLQVQISEATHLKKALEEKEACVLDQSKSLQDLQRRADEAFLFKTQFMESTELVSQLQNQCQVLSNDIKNHKKSAEETQSAFTNLQDKYAAHLEEMQDVRQQLCRRSDELSTLQKLMDDTSSEHQTANATIETLTEQLSSIQHKLEKTQDLNSSLLKEKDEAFASHQASVSLLTVEIERLKSQHLQVVAKMNALTENLEQREMALHAINSQYAAQAKHTSQLVSEIQKLEEQNKRLNEEISFSTEAHQRHLTAVSNENTHLQEDVGKLLAEKEELERRHRQIWASQGELEVQLEQQSSSMSEVMQKMGSEKEILQAKVMNELQQTAQNTPPEKDLNSNQGEASDLRPEREASPPVIETAALTGQSGMEEAVSQLEAERIQLHRDLQRCMDEIQQRDYYFQQLNFKLQQMMEEKDAAAAQLRAVSQTLRDTQNRCHWLESQVQAQGSVSAEVAPGAPQERSNNSIVSDGVDASQLQERLFEMELSLADERARRETAEEALRLCEDRAKSVGSSVSRDSQRDFSIEMETEEEWEALSLNPNQPLITQKVKGGMVMCQRWLRGRSLYFSRLLTSRARSRYFFLAYLLTLHVLVLMCLTGAL
ncbi:uncharacterized protein ACBR49_019576 [Aulostomus maculatus]